MNALHEFKHFLIHKWHAINRHGLHSPFVYDLNTKVLNKNRTFDCFNSLEKERQVLLLDNSKIQVEDLGAGSRTTKEAKRSIHSIAKNALAPASQAQALFKIVDHFKPKNILELGTSLGLTTCYLAEASKKSRIYTIEGSAAIALKANQLFANRKLQNIESIVGNFDEKLPELISQIDSIDLAYLDGNHRYEPTMRYVEMILQKCNQDSIIILDDIYWSKEMTRAWNELKSDKRFSISLDYYHFGVLFLQKRMTKEDFQLYY
jgi:predicted O-methyltransferase YrrM